MTYGIIHIKKHSFLFLAIYVEVFLEFPKIQDEKNFYYPMLNFLYVNW